MSRIVKTAPRNGIKSLTILQIADHIIETYKPQDGAVVLMWRETVNGFNLKRDQHFTDVSIRDDGRVHAHWKRYGPGIVKLLQDRRLTVVKVSRQIRNLVKAHGDPPRRDDNKRSDDRYRACLPSATNMVFGIVVFPRDTDQDHPLIVYSRERRCKTASTGVENAVNSVRTANDLGNLSETTAGSILSSTYTKVDNIFDDNSYPLFAKLKAIEAPLSLPERPS